MRLNQRGYAAAASTTLSLLLLGSLAHATGITEFPDNGSEQGGRGGAWIARASDPLAAFYNPAGLAGQPTRLIVQSNINFQRTCFNRIKALNDPTSEPDGTKPGGVFGAVCSSNGAAIDPQVAMTFHLTDRIGLGIAPLLAPSAGASSVSFPSFVAHTTGGFTSYEPGPSRYMLTAANLLVLNPTIGIGAEIVDRLRVGASFQWGIATLNFTNAAAVGANASTADNSQDVRTNAKANDFFVPGFTLGAMYSATDDFDFAAWYKWSDSIKATGDLTTTFPYTALAPNMSGQPTMIGDTSKANCGVTTGPQNICGSGNNLHINVPEPMEVKVGIRYHKRRRDVPYNEHVRDPMAQDVFDVEADFTWANNSTFQNLGVSLPGNAKTGQGTIPINGINIGGTAAPANDNIPHGFKDVYGVRLGGDVNVLPDQLAVRGGAFLQSNGQDSTYQDVDFAGSMNGGLTIGTTYRIHLSKEKANALEISLGYEHIFYVNESNRGPDGVDAIAGTPCPGGETASNLNCLNAKHQIVGQTFRSAWPINLGTITNAIDVLNVGLGYKF